MCVCVRKYFVEPLEKRNLKWQRRMTLEFGTIKKFAFVIFGDSLAKRKLGIRKKENQKESS